MEALSIILFALIGIPAFIILVLLLALPATFLKAWVIQHLWTWFLVPFGIVTAPSIWVIFGALYIYGLATYKPADTKADEDKSTAQKLSLFFAHFYLAPLLTLGIGWLIQAVFL